MQIELIEKDFTDGWNFRQASKKREDLTMQKAKGFLGLQINMSTDLESEIYMLCFENQQGDKPSYGFCGHQIRFGHQIW